MLYIYIHIQRHGKGKLEFAVTNVTYEGEFSDDTINGEGGMQYSEKSKYHGSWISGLVSEVNNGCSVIRVGERETNCL